MKTNLKLTNLELSFYSTTSNDEGTEFTGSLAPKIIKFENFDPTVKAAIEHWLLDPEVWDDKIKVVKIIKGD